MSKQLRYLSTAVVLQEVPDEISLAVNITGCPNRCPGCHSPELQQDIGEPLTEENLLMEIRAHDGITCVCFMGGDADPEQVRTLIRYVHELGLKACVYSGMKPIKAFHEYARTEAEYIKGGPYVKELGGLASSTTNQVFYKRGEFNVDFGQYVYEVVTDSFWKEVTP